MPVSVAGYRKDATARRRLPVSDRELPRHIHARVARFFIDTFTQLRIIFLTYEEQTVRLTLQQISDRIYPAVTNPSSVRAMLTDNHGTNAMSGCAE